jgi:MSHA biogenesis protein MshK
VVKIIVISSLIILSLFAHGEALVDPTAPLNFQPKKQSRVYRAAVPKLQSLVVKSGKQQAIINNKLYQKGQSVNGYLVTHIDADKVLLEYQKKIYTLTLYSSNERFSK